MKYETYFESFIQKIDTKLDELLPAPGQHPPKIHEAMRYCVYPGGKRFRPVLVLSACEACGGRVEDALIPAASLEMIHCYSLVHDDLPALDNDDMRRDKPSCHKQFGESTAILAGDALLNLAYHILARVQPAEKAVEYLDEISTASGTYGMIGGQVADMMVPSGDLTLPMLEYIHIHKTGKLITASTVCGALAANADLEHRNRMLRYGESIGLAFQLVDDLQDQDGYLKLLPHADVIQKVRDVIAKAKNELRPLGAKAEKLQMLADYLMQRIPNNHYAVDS